MRIPFQIDDREFFDRNALASLDAILWAVALVFFGLAVTQPWFSGPDFASELALLQGSIAAVALLAAIASRLRTPPARLAYPMLIGVVVAIAVNDGVILARLEDPKHSTNVILVSIASGFVFLRRGWLFSALAVTLASWLPTALAHGLLSPEWSHWTKMLACGQLLAITLSESRRRSLAAIEKYHRLEAAAREPLAALGILTAGIAHQVNNPLGAILASTEVALKLDSPGDPAIDHRALLVEIREHARRATQIARSVVQIARAEVPERWHCDVGASLDMAKRVSSSIATGCHGRIELNVDSEIRKCRVVMNPIEFEEAIVNLIRNGLESRPSGVCIRIRARIETREILLVVEDDGPGISAVDADHVFDRFFTRKAERGGSGLGLAIVKRVIEGIGGSIELERPIRERRSRSDPTPAHRSGGTRFQIRLPIATDEG